MVSGGGGEDFGRVGVRKEMIGGDIFSTHFDKRRGSYNWSYNWQYTKWKVLEGEERKVLQSCLRGRVCSSACGLRVGIREIGPIRDGDGEHSRCDPFSTHARIRRVLDLGSASAERVGLMLKSVGRSLVLRGAFSIKLA